MIQHQKWGGEPAREEDSDHNIGIDNNIFFLTLLFLLIMLKIQNIHFLIKFLQVLIIESHL